jgi:hypothetical protein
MKRIRKSLPHMKIWKAYASPNRGESGEGILDCEKLKRLRTIYGCKPKYLIQVEVVLCLFIFSGTHSFFPFVLI